MTRRRTALGWGDIPGRWCSAEALRALEDALQGHGPTLWLGPPDDSAVPDPDTAIVVATSGSTGLSKHVCLPAPALTAAVPGVHALLGGDGQWLVCTPPTHVTGLQAMIRSLVAGRTPVAVDPGPFRAAPFLAGFRRMDESDRRYIAMVPTQLVRLLDDPEATRSLAQVSAVMVGAAPLQPQIAARAAAAGICVVRGYGATEVAGGVIYDGSLIQGARAELDAEGRLSLGGPMCASGYLDRPDLTASTFYERDGMRWYRTDDIARRIGDRLDIIGRRDDLIISGGLKVSPRSVEEAIARVLPQARDAVVVGAPDPEWGECVCVGLEMPESEAVPDLRALLRGELPAHCLPKRQRVVTALPRRGPGKVDRRAVAAWFADPTSRAD